MPSPPTPRWAALQPELLLQIASHLPHVTDFVRFRAVCRPWRMAVRPSDLPPQPPWLMLHYDPDDAGRPFYCLSSAALHLLLLPEAAGRRVVGSCHGWLALAAPDTDPVLTLLNPLTGAHLALPPSPVPGYRVYRALLSTSPATASGSTVVLLIQDSSEIAFSSLAGPHGGWTAWIKLDTGLPCRVFGVYDVAYHHGRFYAINDDARLAICDLDPLSPSAARAHSAELPGRGAGWDVEKAYLVESDGELLLAVFYGRSEDDEGDDEREGEGEGYYALRDFFEIFRLDEGGGDQQPKWARAESLGDRALFLCNAGAAAVRAGGGPHAIRSNRLYLAYCFVIDEPDGGVRVKSIHVFGVEDGSVERLRCNWDYLPDVWAEPTWLIPSLC